MSLLSITNILYLNWFKRILVNVTVSITDYKVDYRGSRVKVVGGVIVHYCGYNLPAFGRTKSISDVIITFTDSGFIIWQTEICSILIFLTSLWTYKQVVDWSSISTLKLDVQTKFVPLTHAHKSFEVFYHASVNLAIPFP